MNLQLFGIEGLPIIQKGDDLPSLIAERFNLQDGDILCLASSVYSKAKGYTRLLTDITLISKGQSDPQYQIIREIDRTLILYYNRHYRSIQEKIRSMDWFLNDLTREYKAVPEVVYTILLDMARKSPTFFDNLVTSRSPADFRERFRFMLFPFTFIPGMQDDLEVPLHMHQLYAEAIARVMKGGRLGNGFCEPLKDIRQWLKGMIRGEEI